MKPITLPSNLPGLGRLQRLGRRLGLTVRDPQTGPLTAAEHSDIWSRYNNPMTINSVITLKDGTMFRVVGRIYDGAHGTEGTPSYIITKETRR